jgi:hypothetical protein
VAIQTIALLAAAAALVWLIKGDGVSRIAAFISSPRGLSVATVATPGVPSLPSCRPSQVELIGAFTGCANPVAEEPVPCQSYPPFDRFAGLAHVEENRHRYIVFLSVDGGYHGAGTYALQPWPNSPFLEAHDGVAKVLVQETGTRTYWQSTAGSLTIGPGGDSGSVLADLNFFFTTSAKTPALLRLKIDGPWRCSSGKG